MPLREQGVVDAIEAWLAENGFSEIKAIKAGARGYDIAAKYDDTGERCLIEAKGGAYSGADTSNDSWSRTGAAFLMTAGWRFSPATRRGIVWTSSSAIEFTKPSLKSRTFPFAN